MTSFLRFFPAGMVLACIFLNTPAFSMSVPAQISGLNVLSGEKVDTSISAASVATVVVFLSARCPCSASHEQKLTELFSKFSRLGFQFIGVHSNADESIDLARQHFMSSHLPFPVVNDATSAIADQLGALKTPHVFVIDRKGQLLFQGGVDDSHIAQISKQQYLEEALTAISQGKEPPHKEVRSLGCVIKRL